MKTTINGMTVEGTPAEIVEMQALMNKTTQTFEHVTQEIAINTNEETQVPKERIDTYQQMLRDSNYSVRDIAKKSGKMRHHVLADRKALRRQGIIQFTRSGYGRATRMKRPSTMKKPSTRNATAKIQKYCAKNGINYETYLNCLIDEHQSTKDVVAKINLPSKLGLVSMHRSWLRKAKVITFKYAKSELFENRKATWRKIATEAKQAYREGKYNTYRAAIKALTQGRKYE